MFSQHEARREVLCCAPFLARPFHVMRSSSSSLYQSGDTLHEIAYQRERPDKDFRVWLREQRLWTALMVQAGRGLDRRLDELLHEVYETGDAFYDLQSRRRLKRLERELHECRRSVQHGDCTRRADRLGTRTKVTVPHAL